MAGGITPPRYCPYYCEENVWQLCANPRLGAGQRLAIVISNPGRQVALSGQRAAPAPQLPVIWDYHVIAASLSPRGWLVWDLDSIYGMPLAAKDYLSQTFLATVPELQPQFRLLSCAEYRSSLATDRRHMRDTNGHFIQKPPAWPIIGQGHNLDQFIDMRRASPGQVMDLPQLAQRLGDPPTAS